MEVRATPGDGPECVTRFATVLFGPDGDNFHSYDERVRIKSVCEIAESIFEFLKKTNKM